MRLLLFSLILIQTGFSWAGLEINTATEAELDGVKGIGPSLSSKILAARQHAPFRDWSDLMQRVKGINSKKAIQLANEGLTVAGRSYAPALPKP
jgi:competence protein ComEA